jgi:predicted ATPase
VRSRVTQAQRPAALRQGHREAAEQLYWNALSIAREQEATLWELRAAMSLTRLLSGQGRCTDAYDLLVPIYAGSARASPPPISKPKALLDELDV